MIVARGELHAKSVWARFATARRRRDQVLVTGAGRALRIARTLRNFRCPPRLGVFRAVDGGFAPLGAPLRRVAGVSWLYWCNSPRLTPRGRQVLCVRARVQGVTPRRCGRFNGAAPTVQTTSTKPTHHSESRVAETRLDSVSTMHAAPAFHPTSSAGGAPRPQPGAELAREPAIASANPRYRT